MLRAVVKAGRQKKKSDLAIRRESLGFSQPQLAEVLGVHPMTLSKWERGALPVPLYIELAVEALEVRQRVSAEKKVQVK